MKWLTHHDDRGFAEELETSAGRLGEIELADLEVLIRRAALRLCNAGEMSFGADIEAVIDAMTEESDLHRSEVIRAIVRDWMISAGRLSRHEIDKDDGA